MTPTQAGETTSTARPARAGAYDAAALRIAERVRSTLDLDDVLQYTVDELGRATGASRSVIQLKPGEEGRSLLVEWHRGDTRPLGVQPPTVVARRVFELRAPVVFEHRDQAPAEIRSYLEHADSVSVVSLPVRWQDDVLAAVGLQDTRPRRWLDSVLPLLERVEGQIAAALAQAALFKQQQQALARMRELDRMRDELLANVSHELRTPLAGMIGAMKTLRRRDVALAEGDREQMLAIMEEQAERLFELTEDILELSRFRRGKIELRRRELPLSEVVERGRQAIDSEGREIEIRVEEDPLVSVDRNRVVQVFSNLLQNGIRHGDGGVTVRCFREGGDAVAWVGDEGKGVRPEYADEMFAPFSHASGRSDSTGLGLSIARAIVEAHGGALTYLAAGAANSHQFVVRLPARGARGGIRGPTQAFSPVCGR
ncbi:MAG: GAF domain-containing protein [Thermoleophilia bacterium]|nr:GAF domain-containing protein [Thermoleophilia bacterium]